MWGEKQEIFLLKKKESLLQMTKEILLIHQQGLSDEGIRTGGQSLWRKKDRRNHYDHCYHYYKNYLQWKNQKQ